MERLRVEDPSQVAAARRRVVALAARLGLDETRTGEAALVATELATNLLRHTPRGGMLLVEAVVEAGRGAALGLRVVSLDRGPGLRDVAVALADGYSTAGGAGTGLGAVRRAADVFDVYAPAGRGTAVLAELHLPGAPAGDERVEVGVAGLPKDGEVVSGDAWARRATPRGLQLLVVDGLGHGPPAHAAASAATEAFLAAPVEGPRALLLRLHEALRRTRGATTTIAEIDPAAGLVRLAGVGNVAALVVDGLRAQTMVGQNGTVGVAVRRVREEVLPWAAEGRLVMHTDGLDGRWTPEGTPGLLGRRPALAAAVLLRDHERGRDDVTVLVARGRPA